MGKVVINSCYGGFGLSKEACQRYWDIKGQQVWIEDTSKTLGLFVVWLVPPDQRIKKKSPKQYLAMKSEKQVEYNKKRQSETWNPRQVERNDPILVQVVEELGEKAGGKYTTLQVVDVCGAYRIEEYDGKEWVETPGDIGWRFA